MNKLPLNVFCLVSFTRVIACSVQPIYFMKLGLIPYLLDSFIHLIIAKYTHDIYLYFATKFQQLNLLIIVEQILGKTWRVALGITVFLKLNGLIMVYITQLIYHVQRISEFINANEYFIQTISAVIFIMLIISFSLDISYFIKAQWINAVVQVCILASIITLAIKNPNNNIFKNIFGQPEWNDFSSFYVNNNFTYHNLIYALPFLKLDLNSRKIVNYKILKITNITNFIQYFIFAISGYIALDPQKLNSQRQSYIFFEYYDEQNVMTFLLHISFLYMSLWACGFHFINLKAYFLDFLINYNDKCINQIGLEQLKKLFFLAYGIMSLGFFYTTEFQLQPYSYIIANICYLFILIVLPYHLTYHPKILKNKQIKQRQVLELVIDRQIIQTGRNQKNNSNQFIQFSQNIQNEQQQYVYKISNINESILSKLSGNDDLEQLKKTELINATDKEKTKLQFNIILKSFTKQKRNKFKQTVFRIILIISYIMATLQFTYFFCEDIFD